MTNKYYISKCFDKGLKETKNALKLEIARLFFTFLLREITYICLVEYKHAFEK